MFDIGFWELIILFGLGLVILGPERLPKVAMQVGNWVGQARRMARSMTSQLRDELDLNKPYTPPPANYSRPGMDDLKPSAATDNTIHAGADAPDDPAADDRDHSDAGADDAESPESDVEPTREGHERPAS